MIWRDRARLGCAVSAAAKCRAPVYVCRYASPGNVVGADDWERQVAPPLPLPAAGGAGAKQPAAAAAVAKQPPAVAPALLPLGGFGLGASEGYVLDADVAAPQQAAAGGGGVSSAALPEAARSLALERTNEYRMLHQAPPLAWDWDLAASAAAFAGQCALGGRSRGAGTVYGENVVHGAPDIAGAIDKWYAQVRLQDSVDKCGCLHPAALNS